MSAMCEISCVEDVGINSIFMLICPSPKGFSQDSILLQNPKPLTQIFVFKIPSAMNTFICFEIYRNVFHCNYVSAQYRSNNVKQLVFVHGKCFFIFCHLCNLTQDSWVHNQAYKSQNTIQHIFLSTPSAFIEPINTDFLCLSLTSFK